MIKDSILITDEQLVTVQSHFGASITKIERDSVGAPIVWVKKDDAIDLLGFLKRTSGLEFEFMADLTAYDDKGSPEEALGRFVVVYNLFSPAHKYRLRVKVRLQENEEMPTLVNIWAGANWPEREVYDLYGIKFTGHPDLRRILLDIRWEGHPLRKDYPLRRYQLFDTPENIPMDLLQEGLPEGAKEKN